MLKELNLVKASLNSGSFSLVVLFYSLVGIVNYVKGILNPVQCVKKSNMSGRFKGGLLTLCEISVGIICVTYKDVKNFLLQYFLYS